MLALISTIASVGGMKDVSIVDLRETEDLLMDEDGDTEAIAV